MSRIVVVIVKYHCRKPVGLINSMEADSPAHGTRGFITELTKALHWFISWTKLILYIPANYIYLRSFVILSYYVRDLSPSTFPTKILYIYIFSPILSTFPFHIILLDMIILIIFDNKYKLWSSSLFSFLQPLAISSLFRPDIHSAPRSQTSSVYVLAWRSGPEFYTHKKYRIFIVLYIYFLWNALVC
jgi:hypothetical protein